MDGEIKKDLGVAAPKPSESGRDSENIISKKPLTEEMKNRLRAPLPPEAVEQHPALTAPDVHSSQRDARPPHLRPHGLLRARRHCRRP